MSHAILDFLHQAIASPWLYVAIFAVALVDAFFPAVPSETAVITAGVFAAATGTAEIRAGDRRRRRSAPSPATTSRTARAVLDRAAAPTGAGTGGSTGPTGRSASAAGWCWWSPATSPAGAPRPRSPMGAVSYSLRRFAFFDAIAAISWGCYAVADRLRGRGGVRERPDQGAAARPRHRDRGDDRRRGGPVRAATPAHPRDAARPADEPEQQPELDRRGRRVVRTPPLITMWAYSYKNGVKTSWDALSNRRLARARGGHRRTARRRTAGTSPSTTRTTPPAPPPSSIDHRAGGTARPARFDVTDEESVRQGIDEILRAVGADPRVVNNATGPQPEIPAREADLAGPSRPAPLLRQGPAAHPAGRAARHARRRLRGDHQHRQRGHRPGQRRVRPLRRREGRDARPHPLLGPGARPARDHRQHGRAGLDPGRAPRRGRQPPNIGPGCSSAAWAHPPTSPRRSRSSPPPAPGSSPASASPSTAARP